MLCSLRALHYNILFKLVTALMEWSQENILDFIEQYRKKSILWDPQDPQHYNKFKKQDAWQQLADEFETTEEECKRKITSLLASLRREKAKISKSKGRGKGAKDVYNSSWFAFQALKFVLDRNKPRDTIEPSSETVSNSDELRISCAKRANKSIQNTQETRSSTHRILKQAAENTTPLVSDECDSFGLFLTNKLKTYSRMTRNTVQHYISNILFEADQGHYDMICDSGQSHTFQSHYSTSGHLPAPSPEQSTHNLGERGDSNYKTRKRLLDEHPQEDQKESIEFIEEFSDLVH